MAVSIMTRVCGCLCPGDARADREGLLTSRMRVLLGVAFAGDLDGSVLVQQLRRDAAGIPDGALHRLAGGHAFQAREVEVLGEAVVAEVALLERGPALEDEGLPERIHPPDASQDAGEQVVPLEDLPRQTAALAGFLESRAKRLHAVSFPGRFSWIIQRELVDPLRGPVGSSLR
jgi:hypothetical protein